MIRSRGLVLAFALIAASCVRIHTFCDGPCAATDATALDRVVVDMPLPVPDAPDGSDVAPHYPDASNADVVVALDASADAACTRPGCLVAGNEFTCVLTNAGSVSCWGQNNADVLGTTEPGPGPLSPGLANPAAMLAAGEGFVCALLRSGEVECWGDNTALQLGNGTGPARLPAVLEGSTDVASIAAGGSHACWFRPGQGVACWGSNANGESTGDGIATAPVAAPILVAAMGSHSVTQLAANRVATCALEPTGTLCWGSNRVGSLGGSCTADAGPSEPVFFQPEETHLAQIALGGTAGCGVVPAGAMRCWGGNAPSIFGDTAAEHCPSAAQQPEHEWVSVALGDSHACAVATDGSVYCWGANDQGQLGSGSVGSFPQGTASAVSGFRPEARVATIAVGATHSCAVTTLGEVYCWGDNSAGAVIPGGSAGPVTMANPVTF